MFAKSLDFDFVVGATLYTFSSKYFYKKKSSLFNSGDVAGIGTGPPLCVHRLLNCPFKQFLTEHKVISWTDILYRKKMLNLKMKSSKTDYFVPT